MNHIMNRMGKATVNSKGAMRILLLAGLMIGASAPSTILAQQPFAFPPGVTNNAVAEPFCTLHIKDGKMLLEGLEKCVDVKKLFGPGDAHSVPASMQNIVSALREMNGGANITLSPGLETLVIQDLKFRFDRPNPGLFEGLRVASGDKFRANLTPRTYERTPDGGNTTREWNISLTATENPAAAKIVETFNISGFIDHLNGKSANEETRQKEKATERGLMELGEIIEVTLRELSAERSEKAEIPRLKFHSGAGLLVVIGTPESIEVCRKIVFALPGGRETGMNPPHGQGDAYLPGAKAPRF